jgi:hypothetical protein
MEETLTKNKDTGTVLKSVVLSIASIFLILWILKKYKKVPQNTTGSVTIISTSSTSYQVADDDVNIIITNESDANINLPPATSTQVDGRTINIYSYNNYNTLNLLGTNIVSLNPTLIQVTNNSLALDSYSNNKLVYKLSNNTWYAINTHNDE